MWAKGFYVWLVRSATATGERAQDMVSAGRLSGVTRSAALIECRTEDGAA